MKRKLLIFTALTGLSILPAPRLTQAATCTTQTYCNFLCPTGNRTDLCCCPGGTAAAGQVVTCKYYNFGACSDPCWGQSPGSCP